MTSAPVAPSVPLPDGRRIPQLGYGLFLVDPDVAYETTLQALKAGYRHLDAATRYENEEAVGAALRDSGIPREEVFVTTKLWTDRHEDVRGALEESLTRLGLDEVDLYLTHWAAPSQGLYVQAWRGIIAAREDGLTRSIGVCNHPLPQLREIIAATDVVPSVHQIELHPYFQQKELRAVHAELGIVTESWGPLGQGKQGLLEDPVLVRIAEARGATPAQVALAWQRAHGLVTFPKSVTPSRIVENLASLQIQLTADEVAQIDGLDRPDGRGGSDPADR